MEKQDIAKELCFIDLGFARLETQEEMNYIFDVLRLPKEAEYYSKTIANNLYYLASENKLVDVTYLAKDHKKEIRNADKEDNPLLFDIFQVVRKGNIDIDYQSLNNFVIESLQKDIAESDIEIQNDSNGYWNPGMGEIKFNISERYEQLLNAYQEFLALMEPDKYNKEEIETKIGSMADIIDTFKSAGLTYKNGVEDTDGSVVAEIIQKQKFYAAHIGYNVYFLKSKNKFVNMAYLFKDYKPWLQEKLNYEKQGINPLIGAIAQQTLNGEIIDIPVKNRNMSRHTYWTLQGFNTMK